GRGVAAPDPAIQKRTLPERGWRDTLDRRSRPLCGVERKCSKALRFRSSVSEQCAYRATRAFDSMSGSSPPLPEGGCRSTLLARCGLRATLTAWRDSGICASKVPTSETGEKHISLRVDTRR